MKIGGFHGYILAPVTGGSLRSKLLSEANSSSEKTMATFPLTKGGQGGCGS
jgi:hypothetical protein